MKARTASGRAGAARWVVAGGVGLLLALLGGAGWLLATSPARDEAAGEAVAGRMRELFAAGDYAGVLALAASRPGGAPRDPEALRWTGHAHYQLNAPEAAVTALEAARRIDPDRPDVLELLGRAQLALSRDALAVEPLEQAVAAGAGDGARLLLARALLGADRPAEAAAHLDAVAAAFPVEVAFERGRLARATGDLEGAARSFRRALTLDRTHLAATYALGQTLQRLGRREEGLEMLERHAELARWHDAHEFAYRNSHSPGANFVNHMELAAVELQQERWEAAVEAYQRALTDRSNLIDASNGLARTLLHLGRRGPATQAVQHSLSLDPRDPGACHLAAVLAILQGDRAAADRYVTLSRRSGRWSAEQHVLLGEALLRRGHGEDARQELEAALRRDPRQLEAHLLLARALLAAGEAAAAAERAREGLVAHPRSAELHWLKALAELSAGRRAEARELLAAAARLEREALTTEEEIEERLRSLGELPGAPEAIALYRAVRAEDATTR